MFVYITSVNKPTYANCAIKHDSYTSLPVTVQSQAVFNAMEWWTTVQYLAVAKCKWSIQCLACVHVISYWMLLAYCVWIFVRLAKFPRVTYCRIHDCDFLWPPCIAGCGHIYFHPVVLHSSFFISSPSLGCRTLDVYHTSTHAVALVRM